MTVRPAAMARWPSNGGGFASTPAPFHQELARMRLVMFHWAPPTGRIYALPGLDAIYGLARGSFSGTYHGWVRLVHPHDRPLLVTYLDSAFQQARPALDAEFRVVPPDGPDRWIEMRGAVTYDGRGRPCRVRGVQMDVTRIRDATPAAADAARLAALHAVGDRLLASSDLRTAAPDVTRALCATLDFDLAELWLHDAAAGVLERVAAATAATNQDAAHAVTSAPLRPGEGLAGAVWATLEPSVWVGGEGHAVGPVGRLRLGVPILAGGGLAGVVTAYGRRAAGPPEAWHRFAAALGRELAAFVERARHEAGLRSSCARAERSSAAKSELLAQVSHELRTPLMAIEGYAELLSEAVRDARTLEQVAALKVNTRHLLHLVDDLLDASLLETGRLPIVRERVAPDTLVAEARTLVAPRAERKGLPLRVDFEGRLPAAIETDPTRLRQILVNLMANAVKFTDAGEVRVLVRYRADHGGPRLQFDVLDTGVGIAPADRDHVFEASFRAAPRATSGNGLGLAISRALARRMGGDITMRGRRGGGTRFRLTIETPPLSGVPMVLPKRRRPRHHPRAPRAEPDPRRRPRVLVVEDDPDAGAMLGALLEDRGYAVLVVGSGADALAAARSRSFDAALLDLTLPDVSGLELVAPLAAVAGPRLATFVALSGRAEPEMRERALRVGFHQYFVKPVDTEVLAAALPMVAAGTVPSGDE